MQNEPQLSAEMEEELQIVIGEALDKIDNQDGSSLISQGNFETAGFILPEVLHFLATALEEQRMKDEVEMGLRCFREIMTAKRGLMTLIESWLVPKRNLMSPRSFGDGSTVDVSAGYNQAIAELRAKLAEMGEGNDAR